MANLLNLLDPSYTKDQYEKQYINDLKTKSKYDISDNPDYHNGESKFKYLYNGEPMELFFIDYTHDYKRIVPIPAKYAVELARFQTFPYFFFKFTDGLYMWKYDIKEIMIEFRYNDNEKHSKFIYVVSDKLKELKINE
jgi:hypothetical protein